MEAMATKGIFSLIPVFVTLFLAFKTKDAVFSLIVGCIIGVCLAGSDPATGMSNFSKLRWGTLILFGS
ncbi:hypothetical protein [Synergistes jonesii]|uniref:hypothetical protein n=1 Tax=Synergistes jonesii TaxID=2754 RepID=UPI00248E3FCF|nr:hypothetical protein [Synergistes jonesii]